MSKIEVNAVEPQCGTTLTLGASGDTVTLGSGASQSGFGRTGTVDWDTTPKTATFSAVSGDGFFCNTTSSAFTCNLPAGAAGAIVSLADYAGTWQTNNLTVSPNGTNKIGGVNADVVLNTEGQSVTFVYVDSTQGWINVQDSTSNERGAEFITATGGTITTSGNFKIHTFTGPGTFTVSCVASSAPLNEVSYIVVAGGASGGAGSTGGGGGGAGGYRERKSGVDTYTASPLNGATPITVTAQGYPITVGGGGGAAPHPAVGTPGNPSVFSTVTSTGGGGGGRWNTGGQLAGGSGGGSAQSGCASGAAGNTPPVSPPQGNKGGDRGHYQMAGGGGATAEGAIGNVCGSPATRTATEGNGGTGATSSINGTPTERAGGGAGGFASSTPVPNGKATATGGGGSGGGQGSNATAGTANTGGGGGGNGNPQCVASGAGGSGIVIIRYKYQ